MMYSALHKTHKMIYKMKHRAIIVP